MVAEDSRGFAGSQRRARASKPIAESFRQEHLFRA